MNTLPETCKTTTITIAEKGSEKYLVSMVAEVDCDVDPFINQRKIKYADGKVENAQALIDSLTNDSLPVRTQVKTQLENTSEFSSPRLPEVERETEEVNRIEETDSEVPDSEVPDSEEVNRIEEVQTDAEKELHNKAVERLNELEGAKEEAEVDRIEAKEKIDGGKKSRRRMKKAKQNKTKRAKVIVTRKRLQKRKAGTRRI